MVSRKWLVLCVLLGCGAICGTGAAYAMNVEITNFRGAWVPTAAYGAGAVITYNGASYISLAGNNVNHVPGASPASWAILDAPGAPGPAGPQGLPGPAGSAGTNGANGTSVTSQVIPVGDVNCPNGGAALTSSNGTTYVCNGSLPPVEAWNVVGAPGQPPYSSWTGTYPRQPQWGSYRSAAFYKDPLGTIHLGGLAFFNGILACTGKAAGDPMSSGAVFTLPPGYVPDVAEDFPCLIGNADLLGGSDIQAKRCEISATGDVTVPAFGVCAVSTSNSSALGQNWVLMLDGINFRAGPACSPGTVAACTGRVVGDACSFTAQNVANAGICNLCAGTQTLACQ